MDRKSDLLEKGAIVQRDLGEFGGFGDALWDLGTGDLGGFGDALWGIWGRPLVFQILLKIQ